jgi:hypothetical protein
MGDSLRVPALGALSLACLLGGGLMPCLAQATPLDGSYAFASSEVVRVKDVAYRRQRYSKVVPKSQDATRPHRSRRLYQYFGADPDRYFGVGPGSYECFGYDCNW